ncbi:hypothetical protein [Parvularcula sp. LCG005]|uniref:hypothetical protein n=1 Tax=Parvularcula sp. LCG005 TaxID=3078805 RepID=UPI0029422496|nr:hypothetical protein [Parvularcula sp. LCG005]WOI53853.1 hypothetical protein RUI03_02355 [Parvularcula sp. LCG005]
MGRIVGEGIWREGGALQFRQASANLYWQLSDDDARFRSGLRLDATIRNGTAPDGVSLFFLSEQKWTDSFSTRAILVTSKEMGDQAANGIKLETRLRADCTDGSKRHFGIEAYDLHGTTARLAPYDRQRHQIGPYASFPVGTGWTVTPGLLLGLSQASPDMEFRLFFSRRLDQ